MDLIFVKVRVLFGPKRGEVHHWFKFWRRTGQQTVIKVTDGKK